MTFRHSNQFTSLKHEFSVPTVLHSCYYYCVTCMCLDMFMPARGRRAMSSVSFHLGFWYRVSKYTWPHSSGEGCELQGPTRPPTQGWYYEQELCCRAWCLRGCWGLNSGSPVCAPHWVSHLPSWALSRFLFNSSHNSSIQAKLSLEKSVDFINPQDKAQQGCVCGWGGKGERFVSTLR